MDHDIPADAPKPRLCHLRKRSDFAGYGFNLHAEKGKSGQFIGKVDEGSPAHLAGLREGDRIIEVNGTNVGSENHQQVVQRIKAVADETKFLVLDREADDYYREKKIVVRGDMHNVVVLETPLFHAGGGANGTDEKHRARLCHLKIWPEFTGYGFNLHAEKGKIVQYIGKVDNNSPAELAGLKEHDRIVEVNGVNVSGEAHQDVVKRIKSDPKQVTMLVVDKEADAYFEKEGLVPSSHMHNVERITCPDVQPYFEHNRHHNDVDKLESVYKPRLCHIKERGDGKGFGFNLQAEKGKPGQFIGKVDPGSPAQAAGLRDGDRLVEVNDFNVENCSHDEVVTKIRSISKETKLLVIEKEGYEHYHAKGVVVTTSMLTTSISRSSSSGSEHEHKSSADRLEPLFKPRLCHVKERGDGKGFGFNLQAEKGKPGQFIGKVDPGSPAEAAGLRDGDRLVEVNGSNVENNSHKDVVVKIKSIPNETTLLVIEKEGYEHYHAKGVVVTAGMLTTSVSRSSFNGEHKSSAENGRDEHHHKEGSTSSHKDADDEEDQHIMAAAAVAAAVDSDRNDSDDERKESREDVKVDDHNALAEESHEHVEKELTAHVEKEVTIVSHDGDDHQEGIREENVSTVVKAAVVEAKAEEVVKKVEVEKKLEEKNEANFDYEDVADEITNIAESVEKEEAAKFEEKKPDKAGLTLNVTAASAKVSSTSSSTSPSTATSIESPKSPVVIGGIEFAGTAEEARRKMSKKRNVKETSMSLKAKYDLFQKL